MLSQNLLTPLVALSTLLTLTLASPLPKRDGAMFTLLVLDLYKTMPSYNNTEFQARNGGFYIGGGGPTTACPPSGPCPSNNNPFTVFECVADNTNTTCYLVTLLPPLFLKIIPPPTKLTSPPTRQPKAATNQSTSTPPPAPSSTRPTYMYGALTQSLTPFFEHTENQFLATQFFGTNNAGAFFNENWFGCAAAAASGGGKERAPYQLFFALSRGTACATQGAVD